MTKVVVGAPAMDRSWILPQWREHVLAAAPEGWDITFLLLITAEDVLSIDSIASYEDVVVHETNEEYRDYERDWSDPKSLEHMSVLRNAMLSIVRGMEPDLFISLDTDILVHPQSVSLMFETMEDMEADAVAGLVYLGSGNVTTNYGYWTDSSKRGYRRGKNFAVSPVDIIMAYKLMKPSAYHVDYVYHIYGEDLGWSINAKGKGLKLFADARVASKHVMNKEYIGIEDTRCGY